MIPKNKQTNQRKIIWKRRKILTEKINYYEHHINTILKKSYGFYADRHKSLNHNKVIQLQNTPTCFYFTQPENCAFHDLTPWEETKHPYLWSLLGLAQKIIPIIVWWNYKQHLQKATERLEKILTTKFLWQITKRMRHITHIFILGPIRNQNNSTYQQNYSIY